MAVANVPTPTIRQQPDTQRSLDEGFRSLLTFAVNPKLAIWEIGVKPFGMTTDKPINKTSQFNKRVKTKAPPKLVEITDSEMDCQINPKSLYDAWLILRVNTTISQLWPDGTIICAFGYLESLEIDKFEEGKMPMGKCKICYTNVDPATGLESMPAIYTTDPELAALLTGGGQAAAAAAGINDFGQFGGGAAGGAGGVVAAGGAAGGGDF